MALGSTQPLTGIFPGDKGGRCIRLTTYHYPVPLSRNLGTLTSWNPLGLSRPIMGLLYFTLLYSFVARFSKVRTVDSAACVRRGLCIVFLLQHELESQKYPHLKSCACYTKLDPAK